MAFRNGFRRKRQPLADDAAPTSPATSTEVARPRKSSRNAADAPLVRFGATVIINTADMNGASLLFSWNHVLQCRLIEFGLAAFLRVRGLTDPRVYADELEEGFRVPPYRKEGLFEAMFIATLNAAAHGMLC